jgi:hypothetical protein
MALVEFSNTQVLTSAQVIFGGTSEGCAKYEPYLKLYTSQILKFPRLGLASQLKLLHNTVAGCNLMAAAYTLKLGHAMGFERSVCLTFPAGLEALSLKRDSSFFTISSPTQAHAAPTLKIESRGSSRTRAPQVLTLASGSRTW